MALHALIPDDEIPEALKGKLEFGNTDQIEALNDVDQHLQNKKVEADDLASGEVKRWVVDVEVEGNDTVEVYARTKAEAEEKAEGEIGIDEMDMSLTYSAREKK